MKTLILITAVMLFSINLYSTPPDSCLRMICNNDIHFDPDLGQYVGASNPDSVMIDICIGSNTYNKLFAKRYFTLQFHENYYPFDSVMKPYTIHSVSDISSSKADFKLIFQQLENQFGIIYFQGEIYEELDSNFYRNPGCRLFFADYQDVEEIVETFSLSIDTLKWMDYGNRAKMPASVNDSSNEIFLFPNPVSDFLMIRGLDEYQVQPISIFNTFGQKLYEGDLKEQIDVSSLIPGVYFIQVYNSMHKFIVVR